MDKLKKGSLTVEAVYVISLICILLVMTIQILLYMHDVSVLSSAAYEAAQKAAGKTELSGKELEEYTYLHALELISGRLLALEEPEIKVQTTGSMISVHYAGSSPWLGGIGASVDKQAQIHKPLDTVRRTRMLQKAWVKIKEGNES